MTSKWELEPSATAEVVLPSGTLTETMAFFVDILGFRIDAIFPAEAPETARLSGHGRRRLSPEARDPGMIQLLCEDAGPASDRLLVSPNGTRIERAPKLADIAGRTPVTLMLKAGADILTSFESALP